VQTARLVTPARPTGLLKPPAVAKRGLLTPPTRYASAEGKVKVSDARSATPAQITVHLPAEAKLWVNGVSCPLTSDTRTFDSPALQAGKRYAYTLRAEMVRDGQTVSQSQRVELAAGRQVDVTFDNLSPASVTRR
jgi:uncharacterized protein (TIGR03000 family)